MLLQLLMLQASRREMWSELDFGEMKVTAGRGSKGEAARGRQTKKRAGEMAQVGGAGPERG